MLMISENPPLTECLKEWKRPNRVAKVPPLLSKGNAKLHRSVGTFSIVAGMQTCNRECLGCYALRLQKIRSASLKAWTRNFEDSLKDDFEERISSEIRKFKYVRVHSSGEFYSQEYIDKWYRLALRHPEKIFYAYTKRLADFDFGKLKSLQNFVLHDSLQGGTINFKKNVQPLAEKHGGFVCPDTVQDMGRGYCGSGCIWCMEKRNEGVPIFFEKH